MRPFLEFIGKRANNNTGSSSSSSKESKQESFKHRYKLGDTLGEGSCGTVRLATDKSTGTQWACKVIKQEAEQKGAKEEIRLLSQLSHPNLLRYREHYERKGKLYIVTNYLQGADLLTDILERGSYTEEETRDIMTQLLNALAHMHENGIVHHDLKLENVMLSRSEGKLDVSIIDFGFAEELGSGKASMPKGSLDYAAPEVVRYERGTGTGVDVWAMGVMFYSMLAGKFPFFGRTMGEVRHAIMRAKPSFEDEVWRTRSEEAQDMVQQMLTPDAAQRPSAKDLLSHPWLQAINEPSAAIDQSCYV